MLYNNYKIAFKLVVITTINQEPMGTIHSFGCLPSCLLDRYFTYFPLSSSKQLRDHKESILTKGWKKTWKPR